MNPPCEEKTWNDTYSLTPLQGVKLLLAEDYFDIRLLLSLRLKQLGAEVDVAGSGREVIEKALRHDYDVILMDIKMPDMNGLEALKVLRSKNTGSRSSPSRDTAWRRKGKIFSKLRSMLMWPNPTMKRN